MDKQTREIDNSFKRIPWRVRFAYGSGDVAINVVYGMIGSLLTIFYTDYVGVSVAAIGVVMLVSRLFDGCSDIIMGFVVERTHSKWGKSRPWVLWMALPYSVSVVLLFTVPMTTDLLQLVYIFITYNLCNTVCFTMLSLPYGSLSAMMTRNSTERDMLSIVRMGMSPFGRIMAVGCSLPLVKIMGNDQAAWIKTISIWAVIALILLLICFINCKENVHIPAAEEKKDKQPVLKSMKYLLTNQYFWAVLILWMMQNVIYSLTGTILPYYCKYILYNDSYMYSVLYFTETLVLMGATCICPLLLRKFGKRNMSLFGAVLALAGQLVFFMDPESFSWLLFSCVIRAVCLAPLNSIIFGMLGDVVEFGQWKHHVRQESLIFACGSVGTKIGNGLAAAAMTSLLGMSGYISSAAGSTVQPGSALAMIMNIYKFGPVLVWVIVIAVLFLYKLDKRYDTIMSDLEKRERQGEL
ncbi:MFS transporter [Anaerostipes faecis]|uniref:MFS transporter n=1 Tax=Anaerostipes faecis TaxID=2880702 RepID=UPI00265B6AF1|nr:glycoside-pentoside-hexuronide (GPH):cation symporter [Anaerostipes faecis]